MVTLKSPKTSLNLVLKFLIGMVSIGNPVVYAFLDHLCSMFLVKIRRILTVFLLLDLLKRVYFKTIL